MAWCWIAVQTDMTERRKAEEALRHAEERFRKVFEEGPVGIVMFGLDLVITDGNEACCRITGYVRDELIGRSIAEVTYPADAVLDLDRAQRVFSGELPSYRAEKRCLTREGGTVWVSFTATLVRDDVGKPLYGLGIVEDISERRRIEALMMSQNERLSTDLEKSLAELQHIAGPHPRFGGPGTAPDRARPPRRGAAAPRGAARAARAGPGSPARAIRFGAAQCWASWAATSTPRSRRCACWRRGVYPSVLADRGLVEALRTAARNSPLPVSVRPRGDRALSGGCRDGRLLHLR